MTDLPNGWVWTTLGEVADNLDSRRRPISAAVRATRPGDIPYYGATGQVGTIDDALFDEELVLLGEDGVQFFDPAKLKAYLIKGRSWVNNHAHVLRARSLTSNRFLAHYLNIFNYKGFANGTTRLKLTKAAASSIPIPLPPLAEQHRIVEVLEDHLSRLDIAESTLNTVEQRSRGLDSFWLDDVVLGRSLGLPLTSCPGILEGKYGRFDYQALPSLPDGWEWRLAESICESVSSGSTPAADLMQQGRGEVPFLKVYNIDPAGHIDFTKNPTFVSLDTHCGQLRRSISRPGDVVTNIVGPPLGKSAIIPDSYPEWNHNQAIVSFRAGTDVEPGWLAACLRSPFIVNLLKSTARATAGQFNIALSTCRELPLPKPPVDVQRALLEELSDRQSVLQHAGATISAARARSAALRRRILRAAFNGELVDQDPADEPAAVALERLRAESKPVRKRAARRSAVAATQG
ncbi:restriction endonuclease subunit S [Mycolicibacterium fortuitum]|uniref:restriction endonuclease subunit S n=1 Tax=Mycolicibacterium fortuitum TaxID=1766 RepID=UPI00096F7C67|nr:restriction endonuclease subunit S [Mycolicibacterium fortuitum]